MRSRSRFRRVNKAIVAALLVGFVSGTLSASAADFLPPASKRFAAAETQQGPDFRRHVVPLFGRLGCNGRACHGSFQGQGGFRLSLFGYDYQADHHALIVDAEPRVDIKNPTDSLMLVKPTHADEHGGGERMKVDSWQYNLIRRWIESGANGVAETTPKLVNLEVKPHEVVFWRENDR